MGQVVCGARGVFGTVCGVSRDDDDGGNDDDNDEHNDEHDDDDESPLRAL